jgi:mannosyltransferase OCH1-like enzyme
MRKLYVLPLTKMKIISIIPLHVYMTWKTKQLPPLMQKNFNDLCKQNPEFQFHLYDDDECLEFIKQHFSDDVVNAFHKLIPGAYKADLWRLCILYINGGFYMDIKLQCVNKFKLIELSESEHFVLDRPSNSLHIYNALLISKAGNPFLKSCIDAIVANVNSKYYGESPLSPTGPELLGHIKTLFKYNIPIDLVYPLKYNEYIMYNRRLILRNYDGYRKEQSKCQIHYQTLWIEKKIYND